MTTSIRVPCSSANIGPGFDVIGLALNIFLEIQLTVTDKPSDHPLNCRITYEGVNPDEVPLHAEQNLITRTALYVLRCYGTRSFPAESHVHIINPIPLGRGLGSSGAAVVGGVTLANEVGKLGLSKARMLDYCLMVERHPDNVAAALFGGFVGTYLNELDPSDTERMEIPLSEILPAPAGGKDTGLRPPEPPMDIGHFKKFKWAPEIKCIAIIPNFEVATADARAVLPTDWSRKDVIFNLQRLSLLVSALGESPPDEDMIFRAMQDRLHQPYRKKLIPGLTDLLLSVTPKSHPGLLGICLSGAGPTILALATKNFDKIADHLIAEFQKENIQCDWRLLEPAESGTTVTHNTGKSLHSATGLTYASTGVSIDAGNELVQQIKACVASTKRSGADAEIGGFGGVFDLAAAGYTNGPRLVAATDGIGTKLKIAFECNKHDTVGIDLVAMNVNDLVVQGAEPLLFLDYYATSALDVASAAAFVTGVAEGCKRANSALVGGETAEMPGLYQPGEYDAAGTAVGAIHNGRPLLPVKSAMCPGDICLGLASSGPHSNGYSLIRKVIERAGLAFSDPAPWTTSPLASDGPAPTKRSKLDADTSPCAHTVGTSLLIPTRIYVRSLLTALSHFPSTSSSTETIKGIAHITGGGLTENIPRMLPSHLRAVLDARNWPVPPVFQWLKARGGVSDTEFARVWNTGLGMVLVVDGEKAAQVKTVLEECGEAVFEIGKLVGRESDASEGCVIVNTDGWDTSQAW